VEAQPIQADNEKEKTRELMLEAIDTVLEGRIKLNIHNLDSKLMKAVSDGDLEDVKKLLCLGADINARAE
jgi:ankyrin repeat protein